jgi:transcription initiation factor TFIIIB Brf1 subunit/transcription initiation factor TFIIB
MEPEPNPEELYARILSEMEKEGEPEEDGQEGSDRKCPSCGGRPTVGSGGILVCSKCGLALEEACYIRVTREVQTTPLLPGQGTEVDWRPNDGRGNPLDAEQVHRARRLRALQRRGQRDKTRVSAVGEIYRICSVLSLPPTTRETAISMFDRAIRKWRETPGGPKRTLPIAVACIHAACRATGCTVTLNEVISASGLSRREVVRAFLYLRRAGIAPEALLPMSFARRIISTLGLGPGLEEKVRELLERHREATMGRLPASVAAAAVYHVLRDSGSRIPPSRIAEVVGLSARALRASYKEVFGGWSGSEP